MHIAFADFYRAIPEASSIYNKYQTEYTDEHSNWLGRWVKRAERYIARSSLAPDCIKQEITDKLTTKLVTQILVSPYDRAPFVVKTEKGPVLFKGIVFPYWMLEDILKLIGNLNGLSLAKPHDFMNEMLEWSNSLKKRSEGVPSKSTALVPVSADGALAALNQTQLPSYLDSALLVSLNFSEQPELVTIKLLTYRKLIINAFREMEIRQINKEVKKQHTQIVTFGDEQKALVEKEKTQNIHQRIAHEQTVKKQFEEISQIQVSTQNIMKEHFQSLISQISEAENRMKNAQQDCKNKEAQIKSLQAAQKNL
jgi:hypothetical protein